MKEEKKILQFAIIGAGSRGIDCWGNLIKKRSDCTVKAICDTNKVRAKASANLLEMGSTVYTDLDEMLKKEKLDAVIITTPDVTHEEIAVKVLKKKVHVLLDKPLATTVKGGKNIIKEAKKSSVTAMIGFNLRHAPLLKRMKELIDSGLLGEVFLVENREFYDGGRTYMSRWNRKKSMSGGLWIHKGCHDFDVFNFFLGFPKPVKVSAFAGLNVFKPEGIPFPLEKKIAPGPCCSKCHYGANGTGACKDCFIYSDQSECWGEKARKEDGYVKDLCMYLSDKDVHDNGFATVEYENGARASHMECFVGAKSDRLYTIVGTRGIAEFALSGLTITVTMRWSGEKITFEIPKVTGGHNGADPNLLEAFVKAVSGKEQNASTAEQGLLATAIGQAAELSRAEERTVYIKELMK